MAKKKTPVKKPTPTKKATPAKKKRPTKRKTPDKKTTTYDKKVLVAHDNKLGPHTTKAHKLAEKIDKTKGFKSIVDKQFWKHKEKTSSTETNTREKKMVNESDLVVRVVPPSSKTGEKRHDGALSEVRKAIRAGKPIIEIFEGGAKDSPNRAPQEKNYKNKVEVHLKPGEHLEKGFKKGIEKLEKKSQKKK